MKRYMLLLSLYLYACSPIFGQDGRGNNDIASQINEVVGPLANQDLFSGVIMVCQGEQVLYSEAFGFANWELQAPNETHSRFAIASISKLMTQVIVEILVMEGKLDLNRPVSDFVKDFPIGPNGTLPTVDHLYNHRSGIPHRVTTEMEETQPLGTIDIVNRIKKSSLAFEPGSRRLYSSAGYTVLAYIIESIEGMPFEQVLRRRIFEPASMDRATCESSRHLMKDRAYPFFLGTDDAGLTVVKAQPKDLSYLHGAGSIYATALDLFRFNTALKNGILGIDRQEQQTDSAARRWIGWTGRTSGYEGYFDILPAAEWTLIILTNLRSAATWQIRNEIRNILARKKRTPIAFPPPIANAFESMKSLNGRYDNNGNQIVISQRDGKSFRGENEFYPIAGKKYYLPASGTTMIFKRNKSGEVKGIEQIRSGKNNFFPRIAGDSF